MFDKVKLSTQQVLIYSIGNIATKMAGFVLLPLIAHNVSVDQYGALVMLEPTWQLLSAFLALSLPSALLRWLAPEKDLGKQKEIIFTVVMALIGILVVFNLIAYPINRWLGSLGAYSYEQFDTYLAYSFPLVSFDILNLVVLSMLRFHERPVFYIILNLVKLTVNIVLNVYFITGLGMGIESVILSQLAASVLLNLISLPYLLKNLVPKFDFKMLREMASYGFPLVFTTASAIVLQLGDRFILGYYLDKSEVGAYGFGYKIGGILNMFVIQSFQLGFLPMAYKMLSDPDAKRFFSRMLTYFTFVLVFSALFLTLFARELSIFLSWGEDSYQSAVYLVPLITFSFVLKGMQYYFSLGLHYVKRTSYNAYIVVFCALLSIGMNIALIPVIGVIAAAITVTFTTAVMGGLYLYYSQKFYYIQFEARRILLMLGIGVVLFFIGWELEFLDMIWVLIIKSVLVILFPFLLYKGGFFDKDELNRIKQGWGIVMGLVRK